MLLKDERSYQENKFASTVPNMDILQQIARLGDALNVKENITLQYA